MSEKHESLAAALAAFQADPPRVGKTNLAVVKSDKGSYKYTYADLADVSAVALPALAAHGLSFTSVPTIDENGNFVLRCLLRHESGGQDEGVFGLPKQATPQQLGSYLTYYRRYGLCAMTGLVADEDDDGATASNVPAQTERRPQSRPAERPRPVEKAAVNGDTPADKARADLRSLAAEKGVTLEVVANRYKAIHGQELKSETDAGKIAEFAATLNAPAEAAS